MTLHPLNKINKMKVLSFILKHVNYTGLYQKFALFFMGVLLVCGIQKQTQQ